MGAVQRRRSHVTSLKHAAAVAASLVASNMHISGPDGLPCFPSMLTHGNPFRDRGADAAVDEGDSDDSSEVVDEDAALEGEDDDDDDDVTAARYRSQRRQDRFGSRWVVTLAALNGFAASVGASTCLVCCLCVVWCGGVGVFGVSVWARFEHCTAVVRACELGARREASRGFSLACA